MYWQDKGALAREMDILAGLFRQSASPSLHKAVMMKKVVIVAPAGNTILSSITGPFEILSRADQYWQARGGSSRMEVLIASYESELRFDAGYFSMHPLHISQLKDPGLIIIPSVTYTENLCSENAALIAWIREAYKQGAEIASICSGAFLLAATGLLDGHACSTHWNNSALFRSLFPEVTLVTDNLITAENGIYTNGGAYSFLNLILFLVEKYFDRDTAIWCAKTFQIDIDRTSQSQFLIFQTQKNHGDDLIREAQTYIEEHIAHKFSFEEVASRLAISRRNFDRRFIKATGNTPVEYLQRVKVEAAKRSLENGRKNISEVMDEVGYADEKAFREVFKKVTGLSPLDYKARYYKQPAQV
jgi:transcriptional regulator GlxA family with amidase domain